MKEYIVQKFINWALKHFVQYWRITYWRMGTERSERFDTRDEARRRANQLITNAEQAETLTDAALKGAKDVMIDHYINIAGMYVIELKQDHEAFYAGVRDTRLGDVPTF